MNTNFTSGGHNSLAHPVTNPLNVDWRTAKMLYAGTSRDTNIHTGWAYSPITWADIVDLAEYPVAAPKGQGPIAILSTYREPDGRKHSAQRDNGVYPFLAFDVDRATPRAALLAGIRAAFPYTEFLTYWTSGATQDAPRWRVLIPLEAPLLGADYATWHAAAQQVLARHGILTDPVMARVGQPVYLPSRPPEAVGYDWHHEVTDIGTDLRDLAAICEAKVALDALAALAEGEPAASADADRATDHVIRDFNAKHPLPDLMEQHGYARAHPNGFDFRSPHQQSNSFATRVFGGRWVSLSQSDIDAGIGVKSRHGDACAGDAFDLFAHWTHGGDHAKARAAWSEVMIAARYEAGGAAEKAREIRDAVGDKPQALIPARQKAPTPVGASPTPKPDTPTGTASYEAGEGDDADTLPSDYDPAASGDLHDAAIREEALLAAELMQTEEGAVDTTDIADAIPAGAFSRLVSEVSARLPFEAPDLAMVTAMMAVGTICSGFVLDTGTGAPTQPQIWGVFMAPSGFGKSYLITAYEEIVGIGEVETRSVPGSGEGLHRAFMSASKSASEKSTLGLPVSATVPVIKDEIGQWVQDKLRTDKSGASSAGAGTLGKLLEVYNKGAGASAFLRAEDKADARASRPRVDCPYAVLMGFTTPESYLPHLTDAMALSGYANRVMHISRVARLPEREGEVADTVSPWVRDVIGALQQGQYAPTIPALALYRPADWHRPMRRVRIARETYKLAKAREVSTMDFLEARGVSGVFAARLAENALKMALVVTLVDVAGVLVDLGGSGAGGIVTGRDWPEHIEVRPDVLSWALDVAESLILGFASRWMIAKAAGSDEARLRDWLVGYVKRGGGADVSYSRALRAVHMKAFDFRRALETLIERGEVQMFEAKADGKRQARQWLRLVVTDD